MNAIKIPGFYKNIAVPGKEIVRIEALSNYSRIYFANGNKLVVAKVLRWFQEMLPGELFVRVNRSHLVNKYFIKEISGRKTKTILMESGENIVVSRRKKEMIAGRMEY